MIFVAAMDKPEPRAAVFLDRDGVICEERHYVYRPEDFRLIPGAVDGLKLLQSAGYLLVVVTNQAGIARGLYRESDFHKLTAHMRELLAQHGVTFDGIYYCPHHPIHGIGAYLCDCSCRKPSPGMLLSARDDLHIDLHRSFLIGDKRSDIEAGRVAGVKGSILVESGHATTSEDRSAADAWLADLLEAARWITAHADR